MAGSLLRLHHNDLASRIATAGVCLHVIASLGRWHWRTAAMYRSTAAIIAGLREALKASK